MRVPRGLEFVGQETFGPATAEEGYRVLLGLFDGEAVFRVEVFEGDLGGVLPEAGLRRGIGESEATEAGDTSEGFLFPVAAVAEVNESLLGVKEFRHGATQSDVLLGIELGGHGIRSFKQARF